MSATYNWAYKPGVANKYGVSVPAGADNVRPLGFAYIALFGNDTTGNGSRQLPFKTIARAISAVGGASFILGSGVYREDAPIFSMLIGDGDVVLDGSFVTNQYATGNNYGAMVYNIVFRNWDYLNQNTAAMPFTDCTFDAIVNSTYTNSSFGNWRGCIFKNFTNLAIAGGNVNSMINCTFYNCLNIQIYGNSSNSQYAKNKLIFHTCNIWFNTATDISYSLLYQCNVRFNASQGVVPNAFYPTTPSDYTKADTLANLKNAQFASFPSVPNNFVGCLVADPLFNNAEIGDYTLALISPAKNISYQGTYGGARSITQAIRISAIEANGDFDFSTAVNLTIADNSIILTNPSMDGIIETKVITNMLGRQLKSIPIYGLNADRNGQYIDSIADLDTVTKSTSDTLTVPTSFIVEGGAIVYNGTTLNVGQRFTTVAGQTTFSTVTEGVIREIIEAPQRHTIEMKLSDVQPFTTEQFNHFEPGIVPTTNNVGDSRTGAILRGNGDPAYIRGSGVEFPVNSKYVKIKFTIRANNLKP